jgi:hypothetical protein
MLNEGHAPTVCQAECAKSPLWQPLEVPAAE